MKYDELVKSLRELQAIDAECDGHYCGDCPNRTLCNKYSNGDLSKIHGQAADAIEELTVALTASNEVIAKSKPKWIPVTERLPEPNVDVLVCVKRGNRVDIEFDFLDDRGKFDAKNVTHWMPLPSAPTEE